MSETDKAPHSASEGPPGPDVIAMLPTASLPSDSLYQFAAMAAVLFLLATTMF